MRKLALIILDGWGIGEDKKNNAIHVAQTPFFDSLWQKYPHTQLQASSEFVGLPKGQIGGSEVGHLTIGAGRVILQDLPRIDKGLNSPESENGIANTTSFSKLISFGKENTIHMIGLISPGGIHSYDTHLIQLIKLLKKSGCKEPNIHFISDGRDTMPTSGWKYAQNLLNQLKELEYGRVVTIIGRFFAMDRDKNWDRVQKAMDLYFHKKGHEESDLITTFRKSYDQKVTDEFIEPTIIDHDFIGIRDNEPIFFFNFRTDRMKQIVSKVLELRSGERVFTMTRYDDTFKVNVMYEKQHANNTFGTFIQNQNLSQLRAAETEKGPHVTYFFNGGQDITLKGELRTLEQSNRVKHDEIPQMKAKEISQNIREYVEKENPGFVLVNFANPDMVGHTGNFDAVVAGVENVDRQLRELCQYLTSKNYICCITADHGNADIMYDLETGEKHTAHTLNPVPFVIYDPVDVNNQRLLLDTKPENGLSMIAGTLTELMGLKNTEGYESLIKH